jgi:hypothetical protein
MGKPRVLIATDIGGADADDTQSMVHALLYADKVNLVGLVSSPTGHAGRASNIHSVIDAYAQDYAKLKTWSSDYPTPDYLHSIVKQGKLTVQEPAGYSAPTEASKAIISAAKQASPSDPLYILGWGALTDVSQALHDDPSIVPNVRLISLGYWNPKIDPAARNYIYDKVKDVWWIDSVTTQKGIYVDSTGAEHNNWNMADARGHGALGEYYYNARPWGLKMGDTPSLLYLLDNADNNNPGASSWGGAFVKTGHAANYWSDNHDPTLNAGGYYGAETVRKYQDTIYRDFAQRLDHAKAAHPNAGTTTDSGQTDTGSGGTTGTPPPPTSSTGTGNPVTAADDSYAIKVNETKYFNARYLTWNDKGADGGLKVTAVDAVSKAGVAVSFATDGTVKYKPLADWQGTDSFDYTLKDADGSTDRGTIFIKVGSGGSVVTQPSSDTQAPAPTPVADGGGIVTAGDDFQKMTSGTKYYFNTEHLMLNDKGPAGELHVTQVATTSAKGGALTWDTSDGTVIYKPMAGFTGRDAVTYQVADQHGHADTGTVYIDVLLQ